MDGWSRVVLIGELSVAEQRPGRVGGDPGRQALVIDPGGGCLAESLRGVGRRRIA